MYVVFRNENMSLENLEIIKIFDYQPNDIFSRDLNLCLYYVIKVYFS